ncbi:hypothetical protein EG68_05643, partial [Paragonimus skrjabini miyazakii]
LRLQIRTPDKGPVRAADNTDKREVNNLSEQQSVMTSKGLGALQLWEGSSCEVDSLTLARDGGILDWDDRVIDVLDDREMLIAHYRIKPSPSNTSLSDRSSPPSTASHLPGLVRCNGQDNSSSQDPVPNSIPTAGSQLQKSLQIKQLIDQLNRAGSFEKSPEPSSLPPTHTPPSSTLPTDSRTSIALSTTTFDTTTISTSSSISIPPLPPPPPLRCIKHVQVNPIESLGQYPSTGLTTESEGFPISTFRSCTSCSRPNRPAPPLPKLPPPSSLDSHVNRLHHLGSIPNQICLTTGQPSSGQDALRQTADGTTNASNDAPCSFHLESCAGTAFSNDTNDPTVNPSASTHGGCFLHQACGHCQPSSTSATFSGCSCVSLASVHAYPCGIECKLRSPASIFPLPTPPVPPPIHFIYPSNSQLPTLPYPPFRLTRSGSDIAIGSSVDGSTLSTVPEEENGEKLNSSGQSTPPRDRRTEGDVVTPALKLSSSLPKMSHFDYPTSNPAESQSSMLAYCSHPYVNVTAHNWPNRPNRKTKRRRLPRAPPPPPPLTKEYQQQQTTFNQPASPSAHQTPSSSSSLSDSELVDRIKATEDQTVRRQPLTMKFDARGTIVTMHEQQQQPQSMGELSHSESVSLTHPPSIAESKQSRLKDSSEIDEHETDVRLSPKLVDNEHNVTRSDSICSSVTESSLTAPNLGLPPHWRSTTDSIPGYSPRELAEAEKCLQFENTRCKNPRSESERKLSMEEERLFAMKPAPPKRSPLTMLTGFSFFTPSSDLQNRHKTSMEVGGSYSRDSCGGTSGGHTRRDYCDGNDVDTGAVGWNSEDGAASQAADGYTSAHSSDHAADESERLHSSPSDEEEEHQRRSAAAEDEVLHMTELLSKRRESEARRHLMMAELEVDMERDHRLQAAATAMALAAVSNFSPARKARMKLMNSQQARCPKHGRQFTPIALKAGSGTSDAHMCTKEENHIIKITKTASGLGFSLTTKILSKPLFASPSHQTQVNPHHYHHRAEHHHHHLNMQQVHEVQSGPKQLSESEYLAVCVKNILPGGAALKDGKLRLGDRLLQIDDQDVVGKTQSQIVAMLRVKPVGSVVKLLVSRQVSQTTDLSSTTLRRRLPFQSGQCPTYDPQAATNADHSLKPCPESCPYRPFCNADVGGPSDSQAFDLMSHNSLLTDAAVRRIPPFPHTVSTTRMHSRSIQHSQPSDRSFYRCASPTLPLRSANWTEEFPELVDRAEYPPYPDVFILKLDIPLVLTAINRHGAGETEKIAQSIAHTATTTCSPKAAAGVTDGPRDVVASIASGTVVASAGGTSVVSRHMRLGVSVRETYSSRASKISQKIGGDTLLDKGGSLPLGRADELWSGADSIYGGVLVKGIIDGGAAHMDGRLRVGDELLEVNGVSLINASAPLALLRSLLRQLTSATKLESKTGDIYGTDEKSKDHAPVVELLVARQMRHRRSASGHTLASNSELWAEASSISTVMTTTTCLTAQPVRRYLDSEQSSSTGSPLLEKVDMTENNGSSHALRIAADVHSPRSVEDGESDFVDQMTTSKSGRPSDTCQRVQHGSLATGISQTTGVNHQHSLRQPPPPTLDPLHQQIIRKENVMLCVFSTLSSCFKDGNNFYLI